jgi:hypothetical protein
MLARVSRFRHLQTVDGLSTCTGLTDLDLSGRGSLQNVDGLANCTKLTSLNLRSCAHVSPSPSMGLMATRE